ncbi:hypothetical protein MHYP_G00067660 [Metynnis hypsauchen]
MTDALVHQSESAAGARASLEAFLLRLHPLGLAASPIPHIPTAWTYPAFQLCISVQWAPDIPAAALRPLTTRRPSAVRRNACKACEGMEQQQHRASESSSERASQ